MSTVKSNARLYAYYFVILLMSLGAFYSFHRLTTNRPADYMYSEKCMLCFVSSFFNIFVLYYHSTHAPHPKFVILTHRRFVIYTHIVSGVLEFITCWAAFLTGSHRIATVAALVAMLGHVPSAYYQISIVFGAKALMVASYLFAISLHLFCAIHLYMEPSSVYWLLNMFLIHNIYVWCRVFYFGFRATGLFKDAVYTTAILFSGVLLFPAVLGPSGNILFLGYVSLSIVLYFAIVQPDKHEVSRFVNECTRDLLIDSVAHQAWRNEQMRLFQSIEDEKLTDQQLARQVFDQMDTNKNGTIDGDEIIDLLRHWTVASSFLKRFTNGSNKQDISFEVFYRNIWRLGDASLGRVREGEIRRDKVRARFIFEQLDADSSGFVDSAELQKLLIQWGLPENEVDAYLANDDDKQFSFDEFYQNLKPIWDFAYENMTVHDVGQVVQPIDDKSQ